MKSFISEVEFNKRKSQCDGIIPWREVPTEEIFYIEGVEKIDTENGKATTVTLVNVEGDCLKAFATSLLANDLEDFDSDYSYYIKSLGLKNGTKKVGRSYYHYELVKARDEGYDTVL